MSSELITKATENNNFPANYISFQPLRDASRYTMWTSTEALAAQQKVEEWKMWANEASADGKHVKKVHSFNKGFALLRGPGRGEKKIRTRSIFFMFWLSRCEGTASISHAIVALVSRVRNCKEWNMKWNLAISFSLHSNETQYLIVRK